MKKVRLAHTDFWGGWDNEIFAWFIEQAGYEVEKVSPHDSPDLLIYSVFGNNHRNFSCKKLFFTGENIRPKMNECDFALSFDFLDDERHYRFPLYTFERWWLAAEGKGQPLLEDINFNSIFKPKDWNIEELYKNKPNFCAFLQSNLNCEFRNEFFRQLGERKRVDSAGVIFNNVGRVYGTTNEKVNLLRSYRFCISFENTKYNGYITEKIIDPMLVQCVPIYWGSDSADFEFNERSFVNVNKMTIEEAVNKVMWYEENPEEYYKMWKEPYMPVETEAFKFSNLINFFKHKVLA